MSSWDDYVRLRKYSFTEDDEDNSEQDEIEYENVRLHFIHTVFELENEIKKYVGNLPLLDRMSSNDLFTFIEKS